MQYAVVASFVIVAAIYFALPARDAVRRNFALATLGFLSFVGGSIQSDAALLSWPYWAAPTRGLVLGPIDICAGLLYVTRPAGGRLPRLWWVLALYALPVMASLITAAVPMATAFSIWDLGRTILIFLAVSGEVARASGRKALFTGLALGLCLQAAYVIQQKLSGVVQAPGTFAHQNMLGMMVVLALLPMVSRILEGHRHRLTMIGAIAGMLVIVGGGSRGAMAITGGGLLVLTLLSIVRRRTTRKWQMIGMGVLALTVIVPLGFGTLKSRFGETSITVQEDQRAAFARAARAIIKDHPWGIGANQFATFANVRGYNDRAGVFWGLANRSVPVHNAYLLARAEQGIAGLLALLLLFAVLVVTGLRVGFSDRTGWAGGIALGCAVATFAVAIQSNYEFVLVSFQVQCLLMINLAIVSACAAAVLGKKRTALRRKPLVVADRIMARETQEA